MCTRQGCWLAWLPNLQGTMLCVGVRACVLACVRACVKDQPCSVLIPSAACCLVLATSNGEHNVVATVPDPHPATHAHNSPPMSHVHSQLVRKGATGVSIVLPSGTPPATARGYRAVTKEAHRPHAHPSEYGMQVPYAPAITAFRSASGIFRGSGVSAMLLNVRYKFC